MLTLSESLFLGLIVIVLGVVAYGVYNKVYSFPMNKFDVIVDVPVKNFIDIVDQQVEESEVIVQITKSGIIKNTFGSTAEAAASTGISEKSIEKCLSGTQKTAGGFVWKQL